jgi:rhodanese-related sulfurtransferase
MARSFASTALCEAAAILAVAALVGWAANAANPAGLRAPERARWYGPLPVAWRQVAPLLKTGALALVDADTAAQFEAGHIPGAISLPLQDLPGRIGSFRAGVPAGRTIVVYCADPSCPAAHAEAVALAGTYGYSDVREMPGGYAEWLLETAHGGRPGP